MDKVVATANEALTDLEQGASFAVDGFGLSGVPDALIDALYRKGTSNHRADGKHTTHRPIPAPLHFVSSLSSNAGSSR